MNESAFGPGSSEADLAEALHDSDAAVEELCLVAEHDSEVVGHICFSAASLSSSDPVLALAPVAVLPEWQNRGVGSALIEEGLRRAAATDYPLVVVLGHPGYYPRFGFESADAIGVSAPWEVPAEAWMAHRLPAYRPAARGLVSYAPAFDAAT